MLKRSCAHFGLSLLAWPHDRKRLYWQFAFFLCGRILCMWILKVVERCLEVRQLIFVTVETSEEWKFLLPLAAKLAKVMQHMFCWK